MKKILLFAAAFTASICIANPVKIVFDTDMGNDVDDALALTMLYDYQSQNIGSIEAVLVNKDNVYAPIFISILNNYYGVGGFPLGMVRNGKTPTEGKYIGKISRLTRGDGSYRYARTVDSSSRLADAVMLARKVLAGADDGGVVYISVGFSTNVAKLLDSAPDEISPLSGRELVAKKVKYFSVMAGNFAVNDKLKKRKPEYNVWVDVPSARAFFANSPVPIVFSGFEVGEVLGFPKSEIAAKLSPENPLALAYNFYARNRKGELYDTRLWDLTSVQYVFTPELWELSENGTVSVDDVGNTSFSPSQNGKCRYLKIPQNGSEKIIDDLVKRVVSLKPRAE